MVLCSSSGSWCLLPFYLCLAVCPTWVVPEFSAYLHTILKNHTMHACDGENLLITCPSKTTVTVLSTFYGRRIPSENLCPAANRNDTEENTNCMSSVANQKVMDECQDRPSCQIPVFSRVFGLDPCPGTSKYLIISYKCRPEIHSSKLVCENDTLKLVCKNDTVLAIYTATFGHLLHGNAECPQKSGDAPDMECLSPTALRKVSRRCQGRANCSVLANAQNFGDPCLPGVKKHLRVSFVCAPRYLLEDVGRGSSDPFLITDYTHGGWYTGRGAFQPPRKMVLFTNSLEIFAQIWGLPEKVGLYFVSGICAGLVFLLCLFGLKSTLARDVKDLIYELGESLKDTQDPGAELMEDFNNDTSSDSSVHRLARSYCLAEIFSPELMVEMEEHWEEKELPNGNIFLPRDSSPYAAHKIEETTA
ncbi:hypothetical protein SKAU_G00226800 [Synaphobranchus kaupii]|uniref:SUEL-type lectin domain-containing protein n=1 Tax=Synaphobranchus kaupii TaxID=118154 RepID=A0A9Q1ISV8_SYNKA|nr:hypothetical protein SKAU_G00226800 [Synaphobranchus kaupii]